MPSPETQPLEKYYAFFISHHTRGLLSLPLNLHRLIALARVPRVEIVFVHIIPYIALPGTATSKPRAQRRFLNEW